MKVYLTENLLEDFCGDVGRAGPLPMSDIWFLNVSHSLASRKMADDGTAIQR